jgi:transcriptional accessory protein Tex/SPT6
LYRRWQNENALDLGLADDMVLTWVSRSEKGDAPGDILAELCARHGHFSVEHYEKLEESYAQLKTLTQQMNQLEREYAAFFNRLSEPQLLALFQAIRSGEDVRYGAIILAAIDKNVPDNELEQQIGLIQAWQGCFQRSLALVLEKGEVQCLAADRSKAEAKTYEDYFFRTEGFKNLPAHRWLAMKRGEEAGVLARRCLLPQAELVEMITASFLLQPNQTPPSPELIQKLLLDHLPALAELAMNHRAEQDSIKLTARNYAALLLAPAVEGERLAGLYIEARAIEGHIAIVHDFDQILDQTSFHLASEQEVSRVIEWLKGHKVSGIGVNQPASHQDGAKVRQLLNQARFMNFRINFVNSSYLRRQSQKEFFCGRNYSLGIKCAITVARRLLDPFKAWQGIDPVEIGLGEYQNDLDTQELRQALLRQRKIVELKRLSRAKSSQIAKKLEFNPMIRALSDLRVGMNVNGVVTNVTHFGVFLNIGLPEQGLIHISELADQFVRNPTEIANIGDMLTARVLAVDKEKGRISLSRKSQTGSAIARPKTNKAQTLDQLNKLFKS